MHGIPSTLARIALGAAAAALVLSCAGGPKPAPAPAAPVAKQRTLNVRTPVLVKETVFYPDGLVDSYTLYKYDDSLKRLLEKTTYDPTRPDPVERVVSEYDANGRLADELDYGSDGALKSRLDFSWGPDGLLASEKGSDARGQGQFASSYAYDKTGNRVSWKAFDASGLLQATTLYSYDARARLILIQIKNAADALTGSIKVEYGADGSTETRSYLAPDGSLQRLEVSLLKEGKLVRLESRRADNTLVEATDYSYGPDGERLSAVLQDAAGKVKEKRGYDYAIRQDQKVETYYE